MAPLWRPGLATKGRGDVLLHNLRKIDPLTKALWSRLSTQPIQSKTYRIRVYGADLVLALP
jgi:hypothetical protein